MNLKKIAFVEVGALVAVLAIVLVVVQVVPSLSTSRQTGSIGAFNQRTYAAGNITMASGRIAESQKFAYQTFDPAILVLDLDFKDWQKPGNLSVSVNGRVIGTVYASSASPHFTLKSVTFSGIDLVQPYSYYSPIQNNTVYFISNSDGYAGSFQYKVAIRGSR